MDSPHPPEATDSRIFNPPISGRQSSPRLAARTVLLNPHSSIAKSLSRRYNLGDSTISFDSDRTMDSSIYVTPPAVSLPPAPGTASVPAPVELLRQILDVQKEQLSLLKTQVAAQDSGARWRAFLQRWQSEFPGIGQECKDALPFIERAYLSLIRDLTERLKEDDDGIDNDFALGEFLDRYGMRLGQLGNILSQLGPLADAAPAESAG